MFTIEQFRKVDFVKKNWPIDHKVGCKSPFNLVELMKKDLNLEKKF
jgi:hypothetical protein